MNNQISIIGLGWLGLPLADNLLEVGYSIKGSTTSDQKLKELNDKKYKAFKVLFLEDEIQGEITSCLKGSSILVLNTPPGLRKNPSSNYVGKIKNLIPFIEASGLEKVLFIGSTAVFKEGNDFPVVTNVTLPNSISNSGTQLKEVEQLLQNNSHFKTTILRFAGLVDERRHPARMMSKRKSIPNPNAPVNLIHLEDCIGIIKEIIIQNKWGKVYNAAYPIHPKKIEYYTEVCFQKKLNKPDFILEKQSLGKIIDGEDTSVSLNYEYKHTI